MRTGASAFALASSLAWTAPWTIGCAGDRAVEEELSRLRRDVHGLRQEIKTARVELDRLEDRVTLLSLGEREGLRAAPKTEVRSSKSSKSAASEDDRVLPVVRLSAAEASGPPAVEETPEADPGALDDGGPPLLIQLGPSEPKGDPLAVDHEVLKRPDPVLDRARTPGGVRAAGPETVAELYERALRVLREESRPNEALDLFTRVAAGDPPSRLADNASFWMGECHRALGAHERAVAQYGETIRKYPRSPKVPDAMLGLGRSLLASGRAAEARETLAKLADTYPSSEAAERARGELRALEGR